MARPVGRVRGIRIIPVPMSMRTLAGAGRYGSHAEGKLQPGSESGFELAFG